MDFLGFINLWKEVLIHPKETFQREKGNASLRKAVMNVLIAAIIPGIFISAFLASILSLLLEFVGPRFGISATNGFFEILLLPLFILVLVSCIINLLINSFIFFIFAKILQGNGVSQHRLI